MVVEVLFPEVSNLYGDLQNIQYLAKCNNSISVVNTTLHEKPRFLTEDIGLVYMGSTTENGLRLGLENLIPYQQEIKSKIEEGQHMLFTGNALDILGTSIASDFTSELQGLSVFPFKTCYSMMKRHNSFFLGSFNDMQIVGFKSQFGHCESDTDDYPLFTVTKGIGRNKESNIEGFHYQNLYATYLLGPLFLLNPSFTKYFLKDLGLSPEIAFEEASYASYEARCREFALSSKNFLY